MTLNMRNIWKKEIQNITDGIPQRRKEQMEALRARAEAGDQKAQSQLAERKQYQVRATVKSYRKMREDALNGDPIAKERYEKTLANET